MTRSASDTDDGTDFAAGAARALWESAGEATELVRWSGVASQLGRPTSTESITWAVVVPRLGRIECVMDPSKNLGEARSGLDNLLERGWAVSVLMPVRAMGAAHEAFRGLDIHLQGWWSGDGAKCRFTSPEVA